MNNPRHTAYAKLHIALKERGVDDAAYRAYLMATFGATSATALDDAQLQRTLGWAQHGVDAPVKPTARLPVTPAAELSKYVKKIDALCIALGNRPRAYAEGIAKRMYRSPLAWLKANQLIGVIAALEKENAKEKAKAEARNG